MYEKKLSTQVSSINKFRILSSIKEKKMYEKELKHPVLQANNAYVEVHTNTIHFLTLYILSYYTTPTSKVLVPLTHLLHPTSQLQNKKKKLRKLMWPLHTTKN